MHGFQTIPNTIGGLMRRFAFAVAVAVLLVPAAFAQMDPVPSRAMQMIDSANAQLAAKGSKYRIAYADFFTNGRGTDSFRLKRTGARWTFSTPQYVVDTKDLTAQLPSAAVDAAITRTYNTWAAVSNSSISPTRASLPAGDTNPDVLDGTFDGAGNCISLFDFSSPHLDLSSGSIFPAADIVVGGWLPANYFSGCLGSADIIGVTWIFADGDANHDNFEDMLYVEQFYNDGFQWSLSGSPFLSANMDVESILTHENGHALGLDHFGGPNVNQPFKLHPDGRVFDPEAIMNPFYLGGEKRNPFPSDLSSLRSLYSRN
jgi:hypothetical protein